MSWLDDFETSDLHEFDGASIHGAQYDKDGDPAMWIVQMYDYSSVVEVFACPDISDAIDLKYHIVALIKTYKRLTA